MGDGIYTALSGALAQQHTLDVVANNVANVNTAGFRGDRAVFGELLAGAQRDQVIDPRQPAPPRTDKFVRVEDNALDVSGGVLRQSGNPLDLAIQGDGYFVVRDGQGDRLTRAGNFMLRENGELATMEGRAVIGSDNEPIRLPLGARDIQINAEGIIRVTDLQNTTRSEPIEVAKLQLRRVNDPTQLIREGTTLYKLADGAVSSEATRADVLQGHLEGSNVNAVSALNELITVSRSFDALHRVIESFKEIDQRAARDIGARNG